MIAPLTPRFRKIGQLEGASFLLLLGVAMPLKYLAGQPMAVRVVGLAHGLLFIAYVAAIFGALAEGRLDRRAAVVAFLASLVPFGPFWFEARHTRRTGVAS